MFNPREKMTEKRIKKILRRLYRFMQNWFDNRCVKRQFKQDISEESVGIKVLKGNKKAQILTYAYT